MSEAVVAKRYADALFQLATEKEKVDTIIEQLQAIGTAFKNDETISRFLNHPRVPEQDKMSIIDQSFGGVDRDIVHTMKLLVERQRMNIMPYLVDEFVHLYNEANGIASANVYSVRPLTEDEKTNIEASLKSELQKRQVDVTNIVDSSLIGGVKVRVGNTIYDGSISGKLNRMKQHIGSASIGR